MGYLKCVTRFLMAGLISCTLSFQTMAQQPNLLDCEVSDKRAFEREQKAFYSFFCSGRSQFEVAINTTRSASGSTTEQMVRLSRIVTKLKNGTGLTGNEAAFLVDTMRRDAEILSIYSAITTTRLFNFSKEKICRAKFANPRERRETVGLRSEIERTIACGARF